MSDDPILIIAPYLDGGEIGEGQLMFRLVEEMTRHARITVLAYEATTGVPLAEQLPRAEVVTWPTPRWAHARNVLTSMVKPHIPLLHRRIAVWLRDALASGRRFRLAHQILPAAPRYATPLAKFDIPYVYGPHGGALSTPEAFRAEAGSASLLTRLRAVDALRFRHDPWLRRSYERASLVLGVAPYMEEVLRAAPIRRFEPFLGIGLDALAPEVERPVEVGRLRLLHVGRAVRTKGLRDVVRAMSHLRDLPNVTLTSAGDGEEIAICRAEAERLGVGDRVRFLGRVARTEVEALYRDADVFVFPSFRESMGAVLYEAMNWGLPVITAARGGPDWIIDDRCGLKTPVTTPETMPADIAALIRRFALDPALGVKMGQAGRARIASEGLWPQKAQRLLSIYNGIA